MEGPEDRLAVERVLALCRLALCGASLVPVWTGALGNSAFRDALLHLILGYSIYAGAVLAAIESRRFDTRVARVVRAGDVAWAAAIALVSRGALTPLLVAILILGFAARLGLRRSAQAATASDLLEGIQAQRGFRLAMKYAATELMRRTGSQGFLVAAGELDSDRALLW